MKVQILADFLVDYTWSGDQLEEELAKQLDSKITWILHVVRAFNSQRSRARLFLTNLEGVVANT